MTDKSVTTRPKFEVEEKPDYEGCYVVTINGDWCATFDLLAYAEQFCKHMNGKCHD